MSVVRGRGGAGGGQAAARQRDPRRRAPRRSKWLISRQLYREVDDSDDSDDHEEDKKRVKRVKRRHSSPVAGPTRPREVRPLLQRSNLSNRAALLTHLLSLLRLSHLALDQVRRRREGAQHQEARGGEGGPQVSELQGIEPGVQSDLLTLPRKDFQELQWTVKPAIRQAPRPLGIRGFVPQSSSSLLIALLISFVPFSSVRLEG